MLQRFAEGGDGAAAASGAEASPAAGEAAGRKGNLQNVKYGIQGDAAGAEEGKDDNSPKSFQELIKGQYREDFHQATQEIVQKRLGKSKQEIDRLQGELSSHLPIMDMLADKYGGNASDIEGLLRAIEEDNSFYEEEAAERGVTVEQLKQMKKLERENASLERARQEVERQRQSDQIYQKWMEQSEEAKRYYPNFDFAAEVENKDFNDLLKYGIDVKTAYEVVHKDEIIGGAMQYTADRVRQQTVDNIQARGNRPRENGMRSQPGIQAKTDPKSFTKEDRAEIIRRVERGETIRL